MKRKTKALLAFTLLLAASSCVTSYEQEGVFSNGYSDIRLSEDTFIVTFKANEFTPEEKTMKYALQRAAELTVRQGYSYFTVVQRLAASQRKVEGKVLPAIYYPSIRLKIQCFTECPGDGAIAAKALLRS